MRLVRWSGWTRPTSTEVGVVVRSALAAGVSWWVAVAVTDVPAPVFAPLTALVVVQVSVRASVRTAIQRSGAVVLGVLVAVAIGDAMTVNGLSIAVLVAVSLAVAQLLLRLPPSAARQVPVSVLVVLTSVEASTEVRRGARPGSGDRRCDRCRRVGGPARVTHGGRHPDAAPTRGRPCRVARGDGCRRGAAMVDGADRDVAARRVERARPPRRPSNRGDRKREGGGALERPRPAPCRDARPLRAGVATSRADRHRHVGDRERA